MPIKKVKGVLRNMDVFENSKEHDVDNELIEGIAPHIMYDCPHCEKIQVHFYKTLHEKFDLTCEDCGGVCEVYV